MARKPQQTKAERLENLAFWYWEYQRRNPVYRRWSEVLSHYEKLMDPYQSTLDEATTPDAMIELLKYNDQVTDWQGIKFNPTRAFVEERHGKKAGKLFYKFDIFSIRFEYKFKRMPLTCDLGYPSEVLLQRVLDRDEGLNFKPLDIADVSTLLNIHNDWIVRVAGYEPTHLNILRHREVTIPVGPNITFEEHQKATLEYEVLHLMSKAIDIWDINEPVVDEETADAALELLSDLDSVNTANIMRLAVLWLWDRMEEDDDESLDFDAKFKKHWGVLKDRANSAGLDEAPWNQIYDKKKRVLTALLNTNDCIMQMKIIDLNTKR